MLCVFFFFIALSRVASMNKVHFCRILYMYTQVSIPSLSQSVATASNSGTLSVALPSSESSTGLSSVPPSAAHLHGGVSSVAIGGGANSATSQLGGKSLGNTSKHLSSSPGAKVRDMYSFSEIGRVS